MRAAPHRKHEEKTPSAVHLVSARLAGADIPWAAEPPSKAIPPPPTSPPGPLSGRRDTRGAAHVAGRALGHVRQEAGSRLGPAQEFGIIPPSRGPAPPPYSVSKSFRAAATTRGTCRNASPSHRKTKSRETSPLIARDFPQHGALERARDGAQALLLAAPRARSSESRPRRPCLRKPSYLCELHHDGGLCRQSVWRASGAEEPRQPKRRRWRPLIQRIQEHVYSAAS